MAAKPSTPKRAQPALTLSDNARTVLERRYLAKDPDGALIETPEQLFHRVAANIAQAEEHYASPSMSPEERSGSLSRHANAFYRLLTSLRFLPNSPTLGNAGRPLQQLSACFVLPVGDSMASIFETVKETALIHQSGGGTGFAFSRLRPAGDIVATTGGVASGPVSFMRVFDAATEAIKQGGTRRGANMAILDVHHPDIEAFINVKADMVTLTNFNISVAVDDAFMQAVEAGAEYDLVNPRTGLVVGRRNARAVFDQIVANAWRNGDPGLVFLDRVNRDNPTPALGPIEATNPCGEQPLLPYESCNLGSLNLARFVREAPSVGEAFSPLETPAHPNSADPPEPLEGRSPGPLSARPEPVLSRAEGALEGRGPVTETNASSPAIDWPALADTITTAVRFLDNVIDMNAYPVEAIDRVTKQTRKIGLGVMGWADLLYQLGVPYDSEEALALADTLMRFIRHHADAASEALAAERGPFPAWAESIYGPSATARPEALEGRGADSTTDAPTRVAPTAPRTAGFNPRYADPPSPPTPRPLRNSTRTTVAPTGTLSIIADCTGGIEPAFALAFTRQHYLDPRQPARPVRLTEVNPVFAAAARRAGFYSDDLIDQLAAGGRLAGRQDVPAWAKRLFVTAHDIAPQWHVRMQAAFQRHIDNAVSKTINFPREATVADVAQAYRLAHREGCKGITIYRDGSRTGQVLSHVADGEGQVSPEAAPNNDEANLEAVGEAFRPPATDRPGSPDRSDQDADTAHPRRRRLPDERHSITHKFRVGEQEGYVTVGLFEDGTPGEIFVTISKEGSTIRGLMDSVAMLTSYSLQYGVPLATLVDKFRGVHFEPAGFTANPDIPQASSIVDYLFRWLELRFPPAARPEPGSPEPGRRVEGREPSSPARPEPVLSSAEGALEGRGPLFPARPEALEGRGPIDSPAHHPGKTPRRATRRPTTRAYLPPRPALPFKEIATGLLCPDCGSQIVFAEGCLVCRACGYTKCG